MLSSVDFKRVFWRLNRILAACDAGSNEKGRLEYSEWKRRLWLAGRVLVKSLRRAGYVPSLARSLGDLKTAVKECYLKCLLVDHRDDVPVVVVMLDQLGIFLTPNRLTPAFRSVELNRDVIP